jgi:hypothetical protein
MKEYLLLILVDGVVAKTAGAKDLICERSRFFIV